MKQFRLPNVDRQRRIQQYKAKYQEVNFARMAESNTETHKSRCSLEIFGKDEKKLRRSQTIRCIVNAVFNYDTHLESRRKRLQKILSEEDSLYNREISRIQDGRRVENEKQMKKQLEDLSNEYQKEFEIKNEYTYDRVTDLHEGDIRRYQKVRENEIQMRKLQLNQMNEKNALKMKDMQNDQIWHEVLMDNYKKQTSQENQRKLSKREFLTRTRKAFEEIHEIDKQRKERERISDKANELALAERVSESLERQHIDEKEQKKRASEDLARELRAQFKDRNPSASKRNRFYQQRNTSFDALRFDRGSRPMQNTKDEIRRQLDLHAENLQLIKSDKMKMEQSISRKIEDDSETLKRIEDEGRRQSEECRLRLLEKIYKEQKHQIAENKRLQLERRQTREIENVAFLEDLRRKNEMAEGKRRMGNLKKSEYARELRQQMCAKDATKKQENVVDKEAFRRYAEHENHFQKTAGLPIIMKTHLRASHPFEKIIQGQDQAKPCANQTPVLPYCKNQ